MKLHPYQEDYLRGIPSKYIFAADTGTGKTIMSLAHYDKHAYLKPLLIVAPAAKVITGDWDDEIAKYFEGRLVPEYEIYSYEKFSRIPTVKQYQKTGDRGVWRSWIERHPDGYAMIADEIHKAKNSQSNAGLATYETATKADMFLGLSASPVPNGWIDVQNYYKIFGFVRNITEFKKKYCNYATYKGYPELIGYNREDELKRFWNRIAKPLDKQTALTLPTLTYVPVRLESGKQYLKVQEDRLFNDKFLDNPSALMHAMRQSLVEPKIKWLENFLDGTSDNVVVFYNYKEERDQMLKMIAKSHKGRKVFRQDGEKHEVPSKEKWSGLNRTITLAQYQSGSTGIELTYASTTVYLSPTYSYSNYQQSIGRTNRYGQTKKMTLYMLCAPTTVERDIWRCLSDKKDFQVRQWIAEKLEAEGAKKVLAKPH